VIDFDCETTGLQPHAGNQRAFLYVFSGGAEPAAIKNTEENRGRIQAWFDRAKGEGIRAWNAKFDRAWADVEGYDIPGDGLWRDGMIEAHAVDERRSVALKAVAGDLFGQDERDPEKEVKQFLTQERARRKKEASETNEELVEPTYADVPDEIMIPYAMQDVELTRRICEQYEPLIEQKPDLQRVVEFEHNVMDALYAIEKRGIPADRQGYRRLEQEVVGNLERLEDRVQELAREGGVDDLNPNSTQQIHNALKGRGADLSFTSEKNGKFSADSENLEAINDPLAAAILSFRTEYKVLSTYVRPMIDRHYDSGMRMWREPFIAPDDRIHATYRQLGARTGRMSCSDPNMQNQPRDDLRLRYNIVADHGKALVACDLSSIEMALFAMFAGDGKLLETIRAGADPHELTAKMLGLTDIHRTGGTVTTARQRAKLYNFAKIYGVGLRGVKRQLQVDMDTARLYRKRFETAYPEVPRLTRRIEYALGDRGYISDKLISGRRYRVAQRDAYKATNYLVQGTAASLLKEAVIKLHGDGVPMVALVHDEVVAEVDRSDAEEVRDLIVRRLTENEKINAKVPLRADGEIVQRWSDAKPLKDENGRPYLFTPEWDGGERRYL
jgi:DNA polymerase I